MIFNFSPDAFRDKIIEEYSEILSVFEDIGMDNLCRAFQIEDEQIRGHNYGMTQADRLLSKIVDRDECLSFLQKLPFKEREVLERIMRKPGKMIICLAATVLKNASNEWDIVLLGTMFINNYHMFKLRLNAFMLSIFI